MTLIRATAFLFGLSADTKSICVLVEEFLALSTIYYFIFHNIRCFCFFHAHTSRNTRQTSRKGRNPGQNARTRCSILFSFLHLQKFWVVLSNKTKCLIQSIFRNTTCHIIFHNLIFLENGFCKMIFNFNLKLIIRITI